MEKKLYESGLELYNKEKLPKKLFHLSFTKFSEKGGKNSKLPIIIMGDAIIKIHHHQGQVDKL